MALKAAIPVDFSSYFPTGAYAIGVVERAIEWNDKGEQVGQQHDKQTSKPIWLVRVIDADPDARKGQNEVTVKVAASTEPTLPPEANGVPFRPVIFDDLSVVPYVNENGGRPRVAYSLRATGVRAPNKPRGEGS